MGRALRLDDVSCAICMDSLFNKRDDLDEVEPVATPDCGHIFHEKCLLSWFKTQTDVYINAMRDQYPRESTPTGSEAPVECPTCRTEVYLDDTTGEIAIRRLFLNLGGDCNSSQIGSSPPPASRMTMSSKIDQEVLGYARRAKGLQAEFESFNADSMPDDVNGALGRAERLQGDMISKKALLGIETYVGGLTTAINDFKNVLETHPIIQTVLDEVKELKAQVRRTKEDMREMATITLPQRIAAAREEEKAKRTALIRKHETELKTMEKNYKSEKAARQNAKKAASDAEEAHRRTTETLERKVAELEKDNLNHQAIIADRSKALKLYQAKIDSVKKYKYENEKLKNEIKRLSSVQALATKARDSATDPVARELESPFDSLGADLHKGYSNLSSPPLDQDSTHLSNLDAMADESLMITMPHNSSLLVGSSPIAGPSRNPTARTITCEIKPKRKRTNGTRSKYFSNGNDDMVPCSEDEEISDDESENIVNNDNDDNDEIHMIEYPKSASIQKGTTNPFATTKTESEKRKMLGNSSEFASKHRSMTKPTEVVDLTKDDTSPRRPLLNVDNRQGVAGVKKVNRKPSTTEMLGLSDAQGRPLKGIAGGAKVRRRA